jgi:Pyridoxamine 5'-phosphate oxidase
MERNSGGPRSLVPPWVNLNGMSRLSLSDEEVRAFLAEPLLAVIGTARRDGTVALNPEWFEHRDDELWLNSYTSAQWPKRLERERRATVLIVDPTDMLRRAQLVCDLVSVSSEGARDHIDRLAVRYLGTGYAGPHQERLIVRLAPERVFGEINRPRAAGSDRETTR